MLNYIIKIDHRVSGYLIIYNRTNEARMFFLIIRYNVKEKCMSELGQKIFNEGKIEKQIEIAKNLMDILNDETIAKKCGLPIEQVKKIRNELLKSTN